MADPQRPGGEEDRTRRVSVRFTPERGRLASPDEVNASFDDHIAALTGRPQGQARRPSVDAPASPSPPRPLLSPPPSSYNPPSPPETPSVFRPAPPPPDREAEDARPWVPVSGLGTPLFDRTPSGVSFDSVTGRWRDTLSGRYVSPPYSSPRPSSVGPSLPDRPTYDPDVGRWRSPSGSFVSKPSLQDQPPPFLRRVPQWHQAVEYPQGQWQAPFEGAQAPRFAGLQPLMPASDEWVTGGGLLPERWKRGMQDLFVPNDTWNEGGAYNALRRGVYNLRQGSANLASQMPAELDYALRPGFASRSDWASRQELVGNALRWRKSVGDIIGGRLGLPPFVGKWAENQLREQAGVRTVPLIRDPDRFAGKLFLNQKYTPHYPAGMLDAVEGQTLREARQLDQSARQYRNYLASIGETSGGPQVFDPATKQLYEPRALFTGDNFTAMGDRMTFEKARLSQMTFGERLKGVSWDFWRERGDRLGEMVGPGRSAYLAQHPQTGPRFARGMVEMGVDSAWNMGRLLRGDLADVVQQLPTDYRNVRQALTPGPIRTWPSAVGPALSRAGRAAGNPMLAGLLDVAGSLAGPMVESWGQAGEYERTGLNKWDRGAVRTSMVYDQPNQRWVSDPNSPARARRDQWLDVGLGGFRSPASGEPMLLSSPALEERAGELLQTGPAQAIGGAFNRVGNWLRHGAFFTDEEVNTPGSQGAYYKNIKPGIEKGPLGIAARILPWQVRLAGRQGYGQEAWGGKEWGQYFQHDLRFMQGPTYTREQMDAESQARGQPRVQGNMAKWLYSNQWQRDTWQHKYLGWIPGMHTNRLVDAMDPAHKFGGDPSNPSPMAALRRPFYRSEVKTMDFMDRVFGPVEDAFFGGVMNLGGGGGGSGGGGGGFFGGGGGGSGGGGKWPREGPEGLEYKRREFETELLGWRDVDTPIVAGADGQPTPIRFQGFNAPEVGAPGYDAYEQMRRSHFGFPTDEPQQVRLAHAGKTGTYGRPLVFDFQYQRDGEWQDFLGPARRFSKQWQAYEKQQKAQQKVRQRAVAAQYRTFDRNLQAGGYDESGDSLFGELAPAMRPPAKWLPQGPSLYGPAPFGREQDQYTTVGTQYPDPSGLSQEMGLGPLSSVVGQRRIRPDPRDLSLTAEDLDPYAVDVAGPDAIYESRAMQDANRQRYNADAWRTSEAARWGARREAQARVKAAQARAAVSRYREGLVSNLRGQAGRFEFLQSTFNRVRSALTGRDRNLTEIGFQRERAIGLEKRDYTDDRNQLVDRQIRELGDLDQGRLDRRDDIDAGTAFQTKRSERRREIEFLRETENYLRSDGRLRQDHADAMEKLERDSGRRIEKSRRGHFKRMAREIERYRRRVRDLNAEEERLVGLKHESDAVGRAKINQLYDRRRGAVEQDKTDAALDAEQELEWQIEDEGVALGGRQDELRRRQSKERDRFDEDWKRRKEQSQEDHNLRLEELVAQGEHQKAMVEVKYLRDRDKLQDTHRVQQQKLNFEHGKNLLKITENAQEAERKAILKHDNWVIDEGIRVYEALQAAKRGEQTSGAIEAVRAGNSDIASMVPHLEQPLAKTSDPEAYAGVVQNFNTVLQVPEGSIVNAEGIRELLYDVQLDNERTGRNAERQA